MWSKQRKNEWNRNYYRENRESQIKRIHERRKATRAWLKDYKRTLKCNRCPEAHPACLEFHHVEGKKETEISNCARLGWSKKRILLEIAKCEVICANCHKKEHFTKYFLEA